MKTFTLPGGLAGPPSACSAATDRLDVFATGPGNTVWRWSMKQNQWAPPAKLDLGPASVPAVGVSAVASGPGRVEVFAADKNTRGPVWWRANGAVWQAPIVLGGGPAGLPAVPVTAVAQSPDNMDVFAAGDGNQPWWWHWNGAFWSPPLPLSGGGIPAERIAAVASAPGQLDVFAVAVDHHLRHWRKVGNGPWGPAEDLGGNLPAGAVSAVSWGPNRVDVFAASANPGFPVQHWFSSGGGFASDQLAAPPDDLRDNGVAAGTVSAVSYAAGRLDVFGVTGDQRIAHWQWDGRTWSGPNHCGTGVPAEELSAVQRVWPPPPNLQPRRRIDVFTRGVGNTLLQWPGGGIENATVQNWNNWPTNRVKNAATVARPDSLEELINVITAAEQRGQGVRAVGSSWSNSDVAVSPGVIVQTDALAGVLTEVTSDCLAAAAAGRRLVHVEAGIKLWQLNAILDDRKLALHTMGGSSGQSVAGVLSTSAHGMDVDRGPIPDMVRALHLVGPGGVQHWIEPADDPVTDPAALATVLNLPAANIHYDNDWFNSALVAVGSFGVIYSVIIEVDPLYDLRSQCDATDWETAKTGLKGGAGDPFPGNRGVQVVVEPYGGASHVAYLTTRKEVLPYTVKGGGGIDAGLLTVLTANLALTMRATPQAIPTTVSQLTHFQQLGTQPATKTDQGWAHTIMGGKDPGGALGLTVEAIFDATAPHTSYLDFVDAALQVLKDAFGEAPPKGYLGWISVRFQGGSRAYLSPMHSPNPATHRSVTIEFAALWRIDSQGSHVLWVETPDLIGRIEAKVREFGGAFHWGLNDSLNATDVVGSYPRLDTWRRVRWQLTKGGTVRTFDSDFTRRCGLSAPPLPALAGDYDHDGKTDFAVWRPADAMWWFIDSSTGTTRQVQFGKPSDIPVPGDYDGDGSTDLALFDPYTAAWRTPKGKPVKWGQVGDIPVPSDYDGDGKTDFAVWRPSDGTWLVIDSKTGKKRKPVQWGLPGDIPVPGDYDGDGKTDFAVWRPSNGTWWVIDSSTNVPRNTQPTLGQPGDIPVPGDYDGDGKTDFAIWRPSDGTWRIIDSSTGKQRQPVQWGQPGDIPVPGRYNSPTRADFTVWRPVDGIWYVLDATTLSNRIQQWGQAGDIPV